MSEPLSDCLIGQFEMAWKLASYHLDGLTTDDCMWRPSHHGPHIRQMDDGTWVPDWPIQEAYAAGPPSIAWLGWHMLYWWSMAHDKNFGAGTLMREDVRWPDDAEGFRLHLQRLHGQWRERLGSLDDGDLRSTQRARWPLRDQPLADLFAWANVELTKNAAEIGYVMFLRGASDLQTSSISRP